MEFTDLRVGNYFIARMDRNRTEIQFSLNKKANRPCLDNPYLHFTVMVSGAILAAQALAFLLFSANNFSFLGETSKVNKEIKPIFFQLCFLFSRFFSIFN